MTTLALMPLQCSLQTLKLHTLLFQALLGCTLPHIVLGALLWSILPHLLLRTVLIFNPRSITLRRLPCVFAPTWPRYPGVRYIRIQL